MASEEKEGGRKFRNFDVVSDYLDHHYVGSNQSKHEKNRLTNQNKPVYKMIMKEWKILEKHLPESIYVRVYEQRIDLLCAAIVGAPGTPYHDGLFFFDIALPSKYPNEPPKVHHHSHGLKLNPNLYADGTVCLSLINTWGGSIEECWRPGNSTILQLLLSIQGLVLNEEPYFNEPGRGDQKTKTSAVKHSAKYNVHVFMLSSHVMIHTIRKPPKNFECLVKEHFWVRGDYVLECFKAYRDGLAVVGCYKSDGSSSSTSLSLSLSSSSTSTSLSLSPSSSVKCWLGDVNGNLFDVLTKWIVYIKKDHNVLKKEGKGEIEDEDAEASGSKRKGLTFKNTKKGIWKRLMKWF